MLILDFGRIVGYIYLIFLKDLSEGFIVYEKLWVSVAFSEFELELL